jgi:phage-related protein
MSSENWQVFSYKDKNGKDPVDDFLHNQITPGEFAQIAARVKMLKEMGMRAVNGDIAENLRGDLFALRVPNTPNNPRIFMCTLQKFRRKSFVMLHAYRKSTEKIPKAEMKIALQRLEEVHSDADKYVN